MALKYNHSILIVDDEEPIMKAILRLFHPESYNIHTATSGLEGLNLIRESGRTFSLIISDQRMPGMTGVQFLTAARILLPDTMRILLTGYSDLDAIVGAVNDGGIHRYLTKPWNDENMLSQVRQSLEQYELGLENRRLLELTKRQSEALLSLNKDLEKRVREKTREIEEGADALRISYQKLENAFESAIEAMATVVEVKDNYTYNHQKNVAKISCDIAEIMNLTEDKIKAVRMSAIVHDIGKIAIPADILNKPGKLNEMEMGIIKMHSEIGFRILEKITFPYPVAQIVCQHHERMNGSGYPFGISGEEILLEARILGVADVIDAIASHRPYRPGLGLGEALREITDNKGILYDPEVVSACIELLGRNDYGLIKIKD
jgi:putative two-component system response regulator